MNRLYTRLFCTLFISTHLAHANASVYQCGKHEYYSISTKRGDIVALASTRGTTPFIFYRADLDVNTDGAARSYHPDDPRGLSFALNNMGNAITRAWNANGHRIRCDGGNAANRRGACFSEYIDAFEGARELNFNPRKFPRIETKGIIPWEESTLLGHNVPCLNKLGYFVSQTSLTLNRNLDICDQDRYVDSMSINAVVYVPGKLRAQGVVSDKGDLVIVRDRDTGRVAFALHGDSNPVRLGEGTIALAAELSGKTVSPSATKTEIYGLKRNNIDYLIFPKNDVERHWRNLGGTTQAKIEEYGQSLFAEWGGLSRLDACSSAYDSSLSR